MEVDLKFIVFFEEVEYFLEQKPTNKKLFNLDNQFHSELVTISFKRK